MSDPDPTEFILAQTQIAMPSLVPELRLHMATAVTPLWQATEATLHKSNLPPPYWAFAWPGGQALARYLLDRPEVAHGKRVLDFAAGCGVAAIAAAKSAAATVVATEIDRLAASALAMNARLNGVSVTVVTEDVVARNPSEVAQESDLILAGDVFYERPMAVHIEPWLRGLARHGATVLVADPGRTYLPKAGLHELARYTVPTVRDLEDRETRETVIYVLEG